ncbi:MAG: DUF4276 family protein [Alphaproteobacteria bacterium]|jgi:hypothetical protein|nr:DUF4276 family protein [Alphaproteobacteria bacterium]
MMIEFLTEEPSMEAVLHEIVPEILQGRAEHKVINLQSKARLLRVLRDRYRAYARRMQTEDLRVVVLVDRDRDDCVTLKGKLEAAARDCGLPTKTSPRNDGVFFVVSRIVIEELEAWFFGDLEAVRQAYPGFPRGLEKRSAYRDPDAITGGTWERLHKELQTVGYYKEKYPKVLAARKIGSHLQMTRNRSRSFQCFRLGVEALLPNER